LALPKGLENMTRRDWEHVADEGICDLIDRQIIRLYIVGRLPQMDAAAEIGVDRKTISRRLPHIYNTARRLTGQPDKEKTP
jgi:hypothetical protein